MDGKNVSVCDGSPIPPTKLEYRVNYLLPKTTYYFRVKAFTKVGGGWFTDVINVSTEHEYPVPQILVATLDAVRISDLDRGVNDTITRHFAIEVAYYSAENKIYWINEMQDLVVGDIDSSNATKILQAENPPSSLCLDWVTRTLFWTEPTSKDGSNSHIMRLDLTAWEAGLTVVEKIVTTVREAFNLDISPIKG